MTTTADLCRCGKPAEHVNADPDSQEWACRVPPPAADTRTEFCANFDREIYIESVALHIENRIRARGTLTVDELGVIAGVLDCAASELLPSDLPSATADHGVTINEAHVGGQAMFEAMCLCGWMSDGLVDDRRRAVAAGHWHVEDERLIAQPAHPSFGLLGGTR